MTSEPNRLHCADNISIGCGVTVNNPSSYGTAFNQAEGGVYATLIENNAIRVWHWPRRAIPRDVMEGRPTPSAWGQPVGDLSGYSGGCDVSKTFHTQTIVRGPHSLRT